MFLLGPGVVVATPAWAQAAINQPIVQVASASVNQGSQIQLNGRTYSVAWTQWQNPNQSGQLSTGISDSGLNQRFGARLSSTNDFRQQPVQWFTPKPISLATRFSENGTHRYLDISAFARTVNWQVQPQGNVLKIQAPSSQIGQVRSGRQQWGHRLVVDLDKPTPWQMERLTNSRTGKTDREFVLAIDATAASSLAKSWKFPAKSALKSLKITRKQGRTLLSGVIAGTMRPRVWMLTNPNRLVIDIQAGAPEQRSIRWAPGILRQERVIALGNRQYPVTWLALNPDMPGLKLQPIWGNRTALLGIHPLLSMAKGTQVAAAINAGFFNRKNKTPLGAIRQNGQWISSPILNRGVVAWNEQGQLQMGRLNLQQTLSTSSGQRLSIVSLDSGYPQKGIARYTPTWGPAYTPILKTEKIVTVIGDRVVSEKTSSSAKSFAIPKNGYLLVLRSFNVGGALATGTQLKIQTSTSPSTFEAFPNIIGAGPLLVSNGQVVLNAKTEQFRPPFDTQAAPRSGIGQTADGTILLAAVHNRVGGPGPTLKEWAVIMQRLGSVNALNLDGGSSTSLYLGGQLLDRHPVTAARVQNGIGVFWQPNAR
ncbi:phosphodiester glycosidase family protein [Acaryochloris sp. IP29b_bin.148]|uniref:phosphodiester glycosidase family protein n=1 Tax=Acaryochloris sp. IP29b_bin.148 TaxID=2969218 RepID=UPI00262C2806|nr:phosphodiester glycosidase family protein [Acaryochloris sp. IP29b_bin.148]